VSVWLRSDYRKAGRLTRLVSLVYALLASGGIFIYMDLKGAAPIGRLASAVGWFAFLLPLFWTLEMWSRGEPVEKPGRAPIKFNQPLQRTPVILKENPIYELAAKLNSWDNPTKTKRTRKKIGPKLPDWLTAAEALELLNHVTTGQHPTSRSLEPAFTRGRSKKLRREFMNTNLGVKRPKAPPGSWAFTQRAKKLILATE